MDNLDKDFAKGFWFPTLLFLISTIAFFVTITIYTINNESFLGLAIIFGSIAILFNSSLNLEKIKLMFKRTYKYEKDKRVYP